MEKLEKDWVKYPVLHLDLNTEKYDIPESLENKLNGALVEWEKMYGAESSGKSLAMRFEGIIKRACRQEMERIKWISNFFVQVVKRNEKNFERFCSINRFLSRRDGKKFHW